jgi:hypothetical protein
MVLPRESNVSGKPRSLVWVGVIGFFALASAVQVAVYGAPSMLHFGSYALSSWVSPLFAIAWLLVPAAFAAIAASRALRAASSGAGRANKVLAATSVVLLALLSIFVGAFISFNTWGT